MTGVGHPMARVGRHGWILAIAAGGLVATLWLAVRTGMGLPDAGRVAAVALASAAAAGGMGAGAMYALRGRSVATQATVVGLTAVATVALGTVAAARSMFLEAHDLDALGVILAAAVTVAALVALGMSGRVERASRALQRAARGLGEGPGRPASGNAAATTPRGPLEFAALERELEATACRLEETKSRERRLEAARRELVAWVSHDLRTPLAAIKAMSEALVDNVAVDRATVARYHRTIRHEVERLSELVDDLFELSVIQAGALKLEYERVSLRDLVSDAIAAQQASAVSKHVRLVGRMAGDGSIEVRLAPRAVNRVLRNLMENAVRHTPSDGAVFVEAGVREGRAFVAVEDGCGGIPRGDLPRVFETSFRGQAARTRTSAGTGAGLGLAIARGIAEAHRGSITVRNVEAGCRFELSVPAGEAKFTVL
jgi:signal transduction histidine kinase